MKEHKKIAFFMTALHSGGGEKVTVDMMNYLSANGYEVSLVIMEMKGMHTASLSHSIRIIDLKSERFSRAFFKCISFMRNERPEIVFSSSAHFNVMMLASLFFSGISAISIVRVGIPLSILFDKFTSWKDRLIIPALTSFFYKKADAVVANSYGIAKDIAKVTGMHEKDIKVIYNPKDICAIKKMTEVELPGIFKKYKGPFIVSVGRFTEQKDCPTLIEAFAIVRNKIPAHLILLGDGARRQHIEEMVNRLGISEHVSFEGNQMNPYVFMKNADVFVLSSRWEGLPNVIMEALICDATVVATDSPAGGSRELLAPGTLERSYLKDEIEIAQNGILVPVGNPELLAQGVQEALSRKPFSTQLPNLGISHITAEYEKLF
jgi:glycosyltransferase involved in cell wall biosynthesis